MYRLCVHLSLTHTIFTVDTPKTSPNAAPSSFSQLIHSTLSKADSNIWVFFQNDKPSLCNSGAGGGGLDTFCNSIIDGSNQRSSFWIDSYWLWFTAFIAIYNPKSTISRLSLSQSAIGLKAGRGWVGQSVRSVGQSVGRSIGRSPTVGRSVGRLVK